MQFLSCASLISSTSVLRMVLAATTLGSAGKNDSVITQSSVGHKFNMALLCVLHSNR